MTRLVEFLIVSASALTVTAHAFADSPRDEIDAANIGFAAAFNIGDAGAASTYSANDAAIFPPGAPRIDGRSAIEAYWTGAVEAGFTNVELRAMEVVEAGDYVIETGEASLSAPDASGAMKNSAIKYIVVWKREDGADWKIYRDIWNESDLLE